MKADAARLVPDAEAAFTVRATKKGSKYSAGNTFWLAADAKPESTLEMLAREVRSAAMHVSLCAR